MTKGVQASPHLSPLLLGRLQISICDLLALYERSKVSVKAPVAELLESLPSQEECDSRMGDKRPSALTYTYYPPLFHFEGMLQCIEEIEEKYPRRPKLWFSSVFGERHTQDIWCAREDVDPEFLRFVWEGDATFAVIVRAVIRIPDDFRQHIFVGFSSP